MRIFSSRRANLPALAGVLPVIVKVIAQIPALTFILTSMLAMGLSLTIKQIVDPLRNVLVMVMLVGILGLILLMVIAGKMGRRVQSGSEQEQVEAVRGGG